MLNQNHLLLLLGLTGSFISDISMTTSAVSTSTTAGTPISTGAAQIDPTCPGGVGHLGTNYTIVGDRSNYTGFVWVRPGGTFVVTCNPNCSPVARYKATNDTPSVLIIESVQKIDAGTWSIGDATDETHAPVGVCKLTVAKTPECTVSSDGDTDALDLDTTLLLTVNVTEYYCSEEADLSLITGAVLETLKISHKVSDVTSEVINQTVGINLSSLGDVRVRFTCDATSYNLSSRGVQRLLKTPPQCNISSDTDTNALELGTNLTLTLELREYYCSQQAGFDLTTGSVTDVLLQNQTTNSITDTVQNHSFNVTADRFGDVRVRFTCDATSYNLSCRGVQRLLKTPPQCNISSDTDTNALELGTNLTLTLELREYYCSQQAGFDLTTGSVTDVLLQNQTTNSITDTVQNHSFNVTADRFGDVRVRFTCDATSYNLSCRGVQRLLKTPPQCNISSDTDTNALELGTNLTLTLELREYYCSQQAGFDLTTGSVTDVLLQNQTTNSITDTVQNHSFNVTADRFGDVRVRFTCDATSYNLSCRGVQRLLKTPPQCNISSDTDTNALELGTNLTLTLELREYYCSQQAGFDLTTGSVTDVLLQNQTTNSITDTVQNHSFNVTADRFGDVRVRFTCDATSYNLSCRGVQRLLKTPPQCNISSDTDTNALELGTNLTLTLELRGYYCSQQARFDLTTGSVTDVLFQNQTTNITDTVHHHSFNVTADRFGDVRVIFTCDNTLRTLTCGGVSKLTAAASTTTTPETSTNNSNNSMQTSSPSPSEESTTLENITSTTNLSPTDLTLGLAIGLPVFVCVAVIVIACILQRKRLKQI